MTTSALDSERYPIGRFVAPSEYSGEWVLQWISKLEELPALLEAALKLLPAERLDTPYRKDGWTARQVVHHLADSHMNAYIRFKLAITEDFPTIKPYNEAAWALLEDGRHAPIEMSVALIRDLHRRWVFFLKSLKAADLQRRFYHPESGKEYVLWLVIGLYAWHGEHHLAHIRSVIQK